MQQICDEEVANVGSYLGVDEYGLEYALTITRADGTEENYSKEMLGEYIGNAWGREYPLVFYSVDEANSAIAEYKGTLNIAEGDIVDERIDITPQPQASVVLMDQYTGEVKAIVGGRGDKTASLSLNRATDSPRQAGAPNNNCRNCCHLPAFSERERPGHNLRGQQDSTDGTAELDD